MLEMAVNIHPREPRIQSNLGLSYLIGGEVENAVKAFEVLLLLEPDYAVNRKLLNLVKEIKLGAKPMPKCEADIAKMM